jgi:hypothetical protein
VEAIARRKSEHATGDDAPVGEVEEGTATWRCGRNDHEWRVGKAGLQG